MSLRRSHRKSHSAATSFLRATFRIEPHSDAGCPVANVGKRGDEISQDFLYPETDCDDGECRSELIDRTDGRSTYVQTDVTDRCICPAFRRHDCIASIDEARNGSLYVSVTTPTRTELEAIVETLRDTGATVHLERIGSSSDEPDTAGRRLTIETDDLTEKQRNAVVVAVESGYYETPRKADLGDLADELGVSRSAVSQRLNAVESKLVTSLVNQ